MKGNICNCLQVMVLQNGITVLNLSEVLQHFHSWEQTLCLNMATATVVYSYGNDMASG
jgi:hypothetical protein